MEIPLPEDDLEGFSQGDLCEDVDSPPAVVELPDAGLPAAVELPDADDPSTNILESVKGCRCGKECRSKLDQEELHKFVKALEGKSGKERYHVMFGMLRAQMEGGLTQPGSRLRFRFLGVPVCVNEFSFQTGLSRPKITKFRKAILRGAVEPPPDGRINAARSLRSRALSCRKWSANKRA